MMGRWVVVASAIAAAGCSTPQPAYQFEGSPLERAMAGYRGCMTDAVQVYAKTSGTPTEVVDAAGGKCAGDLKAFELASFDYFTSTLPSRISRQMLQDKAREQASDLSVRTRELLLGVVLQTRAQH